MKYVFKVDLHIFDEQTGLDKRNFTSSILLNCYDGLSEDYIRQSIVTACQSAIDVMEDL